MTQVQTISKTKLQKLIEKHTELIYRREERGVETSDLITIIESMNDIVKTLDTLADSMDMLLQLQSTETRITNLITQPQLLAPLLLNVIVAALFEGGLLWG